MANGLMVESAPRIMMIKYRFRDWDINFVRPAAKFYTTPLPYAKRNSVILSSGRVWWLSARTAAVMFGLRQPTRPGNGVAVNKRIGIFRNFSTRFGNRRMSAA
jgi:hypothetical protein